MLYNQVYDILILFINMYLNLNLTQRCSYIHIIKELHTAQKDHLPKPAKYSAGSLV